MSVDDLHPGEPVTDPPEGGTSEPEPQYTQIGEDRYRWDDGVITDAQGNEITEDESQETPPATPPVETPPAPVAATPTPTPAATPAPTPATPPAEPQRQIFTREGIRDHVFTEDAMQRIADMRLTDPLAAEREYLRLNDQYQQGIANLSHHASTVFEAELDELAKQAPESVNRFARGISRLKSTLTPEQLQQPGAAKYAVSQVIAQAFTNDPLMMEEAVLRSLTPGGTPAPTPTPPTPTPPTPPPNPKERILPPELRTPGPGTGRTPEARRRAIESGDPFIAHYMRLYSISAEEAKEMADTMRAQDASRDQTRVYG